MFYYLLEIPHIKSLFLNQENKIRVNMMKNDTTKRVESEDMLDMMTDDDEAPQTFSDVAVEKVNEIWRRCWTERENRFEEEMLDLIDVYEEKLTTQRSDMEERFVELQRTSQQKVDELRSKIGDENFQRAQEQYLLLERAEKTPRRAVPWENENCR